MSDRTRSLDQRILEAEATVRDRIRELRGRLEDIEVKIQHRRILNPLGELQQAAPQVDAAVAVLATLNDLKRSGTYWLDHH